MSKNTKTAILAVILAAVLCLTGFGGYSAGKSSGQQQVAEAEKQAEEARKQTEEAGKQAEEVQTQLEEAEAQLEEAQERAEQAEKEAVEVQTQMAEVQSQVVGSQIQLEQLQLLNRQSIENIIIDESPIYVIGHRSPDSDTVCSAIAYAELLNKLGYEAEARITMDVNRETAYILKEAGVEAPPVLEDASGKSIFLVDHSEYAQAAQGMEDAQIVGVLDHHGVGSVTTGQQLIYEAKPIGATATIVWLDYLNYGIEVEKTTAHLMLGAILSDTDNLTGSTTTEADRRAVSALAELAGVTDVDAFYKELHAEKLSYEGMTSEEIFFSDYKKYEVSGVKFGIGLIDTTDDETAKELAERMKEVLPECIGTTGMDLLYASVRVRENGEKTDRVIPADEYSKDVIEAAFPNYDEYDETSFIFRKGLGRKTKMVPGLTEYLEAHPKEG